MKRLALVVISGIVAASAQAQSSVVLYGLIDAGLSYANNVAKGGSQGALFQTTSGQINGSRFGLRGTEDLGGGLHVIFVLENGFNLQNGKLGQDNRFFGRQAFVGLDAKRLGTVTVGRQYDFVTDFVEPLTGVATTFGDASFAHPFDNDNLDHSIRMNNAIKYTSDDYFGLKLGGLYAFSNSPSFANNRAYSVGGTYTHGSFNAAAAYLQENGSNSTTNASGAIDSMETQSNGTAGFQLGADVQRTVAAALSYAFGSATVGFAYSHSQFQGTRSFGSNNGTLRFDNYELNAKYAFTHVLVFGLSYTYTDGHVTQSTSYSADPKWNQVNLQAVYSLSKRTDVYMESMFQHAIGHGYVAFVNNSGGASSTSNQVVVAVGMRARF
ncbi:porin [Caballeronia sp. LZ034LL]|uniref:porin n=1 Tax=Caballeronia sp. LZ034LL TaxID=3038567 RepID=UPI0028630C16|nr:porin [Caballeronia sp. LZ034LL]MDR5835884.1 porin [Caballeronia sp. LZ034LL]